MKMEKFDPLNGSIAHVLECLGEGWSMLIIREAFFGIRRFEEFQSHLGIARNILTSRLKKLCETGILERVPIKPGAKRHEYLLTAKGKELMPLLITLTQWGDKWIYGKGNEPIIFLDRKHAKPISPILVHAKDGRKLRPREIMPTAGPGANKQAKARLKELAELARELDKK
ncbi:MAG: helix-turn-helix transcriptional regulator [Gammaproteobacteria bacterium]|nr:helix-turn-helix transcriptional regulator [Gammaproteobacteria bacterium]